jgi:hypothetical protein
MPGMSESEFMYHQIPSERLDASLVTTRRWVKVALGLIGGSLVLLSSGGIVASASTGSLQSNKASLLAAFVPILPGHVLRAELPSAPFAASLWPKTPTNAAAGIASFLPRTATRAAKAEEIVPQEADEGTLEAHGSGDTFGRFLDAGGFSQYLTPPSPPEAVAHADDFGHENLFTLHGASQYKVAISKVSMGQMVFLQKVRNEQHHCSDVRVVTLAKETIGYIPCSEEPHLTRKARRLIQSGKATGRVSDIPLIPGAAEVTVNIPLDDMSLSYVKALVQLREKKRSLRKSKAEPPSRVPSAA